jgi:hypothetical protein
VVEREKERERECCFMFEFNLLVELRNSLSGFIQAEEGRVETKWREQGLVMKTVRMLSCADYPSPVLY